MRLLPRFSLRFAMLTLTIFLIVFGVIVSYWKEYRDHEAIVERLLNLGWSVEEEPVTLFGLVIGKRLTGLLGKDQTKPDYLQTFFELPRPQDLRRFALFMRDNDAKLKKQTLQRLQLSPRLERLQISWLPVDANYQQLAYFKELRILDLNEASIPTGSLGFLEQLPRLEVVRLSSATLRGDELCRLNLPRLKILVAVGCELPELRLTRDGWGRSPELEVMIFGHARIQKVVCEPGAMPRLRGLDLGCQEKSCEIDWAKLPETAPSLTHLIVSSSHFDSELKKILLRFDKLNNLMVGTKNEKHNWMPLYMQYTFELVSLDDNSSKSAAGKSESLTYVQEDGQKIIPIGLYHPYMSQVLPENFQYFFHYAWPSPHWHPDSIFLKRGGYSSSPNY